MNHSFNTEIAQEIGVIPAIMLEHIAFWVLKNKANQTNEKDGKYWTFATKEGFQSYFPYLTTKQIRYALEKLESEKYLETGCFNKSHFDRTKWYTLTEKAEKFYPMQDKKAEEKNPSVELPKLANRDDKIGKSDLPKLANRADKFGRPIPDINIEDINKDIDIVPPLVPPKGEKRASRLSPDWKPSQKDLDYCKSKRPDIDPFELAERFKLYWLAESGAKARKMDWHATWCGWVLREKPPQSHSRMTYHEQAMGNAAKAAKMLFGDDYDTTGLR